MHFSAIEISIRRQLCKCENVLKDEGFSLENSSLNLSDAIKNIESSIVNLKKSPNKPPDEVVQSFYQRLKSIKERLAEELIKEDCNSNMSGGIDPKTYVIPTAKDYAAMRNELLDLETNGSEGVRSRKKKISPSSNSNTDNLEVLLHDQRQRQDKITENILSLTRNLKEQTLLAGDIVRYDTDKFEKSKGLADTNYERLKVESAKMEEQHQKSWRWWVICLIFAGVLIVFVNMVLLMKVAKKSS